MAQVKDLMGLGMPASQANYVGTVITNPLAGVGTAQSGAAAIASSTVVMTTAGGQTAFVLPASPALGKPFWLFNTSATTALVYPATGGTIDSGSANASVSIAQNKGRVLMPVASGVWLSVGGA